MNLEKQLIEAIVKAVKALYDADITPEQVSLQKTRPDFEGHLTLVTFPLLRISKPMHAMDWPHRPRLIRW